MRETDRSQFRGIPLFSPSDREVLGGSFMGNAYPIMDFGSARLGGYWEQNGRDGETDAAVAVINNRLTRGTIERFNRMGLNELEILVRFPCDITFRVSRATILLPENSILEARLMYEDPFAFEEDYHYDYENRPDTVLSATRYSVRGSRRKVSYFVPEDVDFLSRLRFAFSFVSKVPTASKTF